MSVKQVIVMRKGKMKPQEYEIFTLKMHMPLMSHDPAIRNVEKEKCPHVLAGSEVWVDQINDDFIFLHVFDRSEMARNRMIWVPINDIDKLLKATGLFVNHPDRWKQYGKIMAWIISTVRAWGGYMSRQLDSLSRRGF